MLILLVFYLVIKNVAMAKLGHLQYKMITNNTLNQIKNLSKFFMPFYYYNYLINNINNFAN